MTPPTDCIVAATPLPELKSATIPRYLQATYWWAYIHPRGVRVFERQWLVNLILWGNYTRLCNAAFHSFGGVLNGRTLQIACAYGNLTPRLAAMLGADETLDVIDILPIQLNNLAHKLPAANTVKLHCMDSNALGFPDQHFDRALLFFLLHEQPAEVRNKTLAEAVRVVRRGGTLTIVDYAGPGWLNPMRYIMAPILTLLEPYARDLWKEEVAAWLPKDAGISIIREQRFFGGLYQVLTLNAG
jgi:ubiquinone/menaquinone biosynthesis C-methylase UbiE